MNHSFKLTSEFIASIVRRCIVLRLMQGHVCLSHPPWFLQLIPRLSPANSEIAISICDHHTLLWLRIMFPITAREGISSDCISFFWFLRANIVMDTFRDCAFFKTIAGNWQKSNDNCTKEKWKINHGEKSKYFKKQRKLCKIIARGKRLRINTYKVKTAGFLYLSC